MTHEPDFHDLVDAGDLRADERARLERVHDLLVAAGPPPELPPKLAGAPAPPRAQVLAFPRRRILAAVAVAAALAAAAFGGYEIGTGSSSTAGWHGPIVMRGASEALASLRVSPADAAGNRTVKMRVRGLPSLPAGGYYELLLTRNGHLGPECGYFAVTGESTDVTMTIPYRLQPGTGWVIVSRVPGKPQSGPILST